MRNFSAMVTISNPLEKAKLLRVRACVDPEVNEFMLPRDRRVCLGTFSGTRQATVRASAEADWVDAEICGPVHVQLEGFRGVHTEVAFVDALSQIGGCEAVIGSIVLAQSQAKVDPDGKRLIAVPYLDLKSHGQLRLGRRP